ncbi:hypothetical protein OIT41_20280 (plasmid) [Arthrobacter sp. YA7-1]|uniref:hypothetical protein n=1 Tax=Arthrobacter sp. YA7-1 TaxID=2987701 RepID=UPI002226934C|nr:hypothetical protein [Arthrobacter sp. YA7-1]UYY83592.1 hypothetical protein OIT41_20280 [Arthrobacter sp. YA7-1]
MELPDILTEENIEKAANLVRRYYLVPVPKTGLLGAGSQFDDWGADEALERQLLGRDACAWVGRGVGSPCSGQETE